jgi:hypothetical protein
MIKKLSLRFTLLLILLAIPGAHTCLAQQTQLPEKGDHIAYDYLKAYEGKWVYTSGKETFALNLVLQKNRQGNDVFHFYMDQLEGQIVYTAKNKKAATTAEPASKSEIKSTAQNDPTMVTLLFADPVKQKSGEVTLRFTDPEQKLLQWELNEHAEQLVRNLNKKHAHGFSVPTKMLLQRVE